MEDSNLEKLVKSFEKRQKPVYEKDKRYWEPTLDADGNSTALIRFLSFSSKDLEIIEKETAKQNNNQKFNARYLKQLAIPAVSFREYYVKGKNRVYWERSLVDLGQDDPMAQYNNKLYTSGDEKLKEYAQKSLQAKFKRIANILVISDPKNPENNGKVFLYKINLIIWKKIQAISKTDEELGIPGINPFSLTSGADFKISIHKQGDFSNFENCVFQQKSYIHYLDNKPMTDEQIDALMDSQYSLVDEISEDKYKTYDELKNKLVEALGLNAGSSDESSEEEQETEKPAEKATKAPVEDAFADDDVPESFNSTTPDDIDSLIGSLKF